MGAADRAGNGGELASRSERDHDLGLRAGAGRVGPPARQLSAPRGGPHRDPGRVLAAGARRDGGGPARRRDRGPRERRGWDRRRGAHPGRVGASSPRGERRRRAVGGGRGGRESARAAGAARARRPAGRGPRPRPHARHRRAHVLPAPRLPRRGRAADRPAAPPGTVRPVPLERDGQAVRGPRPAPQRGAARRAPGVGGRRPPRLPSRRPRARRARPGRAPRTPPRPRRRRPVGVGRGRPVGTAARLRLDRPGRVRHRRRLRGGRPARRAARPGARPRERIRDGGPGDHAARPRAGRARAGEPARGGEDAARPRRPPPEAPADLDVPTVLVPGPGGELEAVPPPVRLDGATIERPVTGYAAAAAEWLPGARR